MEQQDRAVLLLLLGAGAVALLLMQSNRGGGGATAPLTTQGSPLSTNGHQPVTVRAMPFYQNEESWELERDSRTGLLSKITVHRDARVTE